jgi:hypothetical protein
MSNMETIELRILAQINSPVPEAATIKNLLSEVQDFSLKLIIKK